MTRHEYRQSVQAIATSAIDPTEWGDDTDLYDRVHQMVDGSEWVIYYHRARKVLEYSPNETAGPDELGWKDFSAGAESFGDLHVRGAYYAMSADVMEKVHELLDDDAMEAVRERLYA
jgi:hypothetical protein